MGLIGEKKNQSNFGWISNLRHNSSSSGGRGVRVTKDTNNQEYLQFDSIRFDSNRDGRRPTASVALPGLLAGRARCRSETEEGARDVREGWDAQARGERWWIYLRDGISRSGEDRDGARRSPRRYSVRVDSSRRAGGGVVVSSPLLSSPLGGVLVKFVSTVPWSCGFLWCHLLCWSVVASFSAFQRLPFPLSLLFAFLIPLLTRYYNFFYLVS